jgi:hypothetical protein
MVDRHPPAPGSSPGTSGGPDQSLSAGWSSPVARQAHNLKVVGSNPTPATTPSFCHARPRRRPKPLGCRPISGRLQRQGAVGGKDRPYDEKSDSTPIDPTIHPIPCVWPLAQHRQVVSRTVAGASRRLSDAPLGDYRGAASSRFPALRGTGQTGANRRSWRRPKGEVERRVERIGAAGDGIAHCRGQPGFTSFPAVGDRVRAVLGACRGGGHEGWVVELLVAGEGRRDPLVGISGHAIAAPCSNSMPRPTESRDRPSPRVQGACRQRAGGKGLLDYPNRETSTAFSVMNSSSAGVPSRVFAMPRRIAAWISPGSVTRSP